MEHTGVQTTRVGDVELAYETFGSPEDTPLLLVMGLATQMIGWPDEFCRMLADRGLYVIRFDNRDIGLSTHLDAAGAPDVLAVMGGDHSRVAYRLPDMAEDTAGLLDALGLGSAHVVGASMGGMIAQALAIAHPEKVRSLTSIMSTTGDPAVGAPAEAALGVLLAPPATDRESAVQRAVDTYRVIGSPGFEFDESGLRERAGLSFDRAYNPAGVARQLAAILASPDRTADLARVAVPTLVVHGAQDALVNVSGGRATAAAIPGAELVVVEGMGHDLPREVWPQLVDRITGLVDRVERA
ncbi:Pimeloyl-ACP methyl ester carboxylesterase [Geodermatophilus saharensis]|uniref:Pimeloyl-ACP methyl ester carboxylesterase n=1 Tax=Geodermatophilus saharensis TaxID=1137994 RepID=A0A239AA06_9ACTN|nr:alpha/beta hydrolase [Geodermatophilus saharensis]SNR91713.1 Pimeloyl-ACP methyl ester carboxylesterase [Geodermatophilus saharensis]